MHLTLSSHFLVSKELPPKTELMMPLNYYVEISELNLSKDANNSNLKLEKSNSNHGSFWCKECQLDLSSEQVLKTHLAGTKHEKKVRELQLSKNNGIDSEYIVEAGKYNFKCILCNILVSSRISMNAHVAGSKHRFKKALSKNVQIKEEIEKAIPICENESGDHNSNYDCLFCKITLNSQHQYKEHLRSKRHFKNCTASTATSFPSNTVQNESSSFNTSLKAISEQPSNSKSETLTDNAIQSSVSVTEIIPYDLWDPCF